RLGPNGRSRGTLNDQFADFIIHPHDLKDRQTPFVTAVVASLAPAATVELLSSNIGRSQGQFHQLFFSRRELFFAVQTDASYQTLGDNGFQRGRDKERLKPKVKQTQNRTWCIIRVQRGEHQVAGE